MKKPLLISLLYLSISYGCSTDDTPAQIQLSETALQFINVHNTYRAEVGIADLTWSEELAASATEWAKELATTCAFKHSTGAYGENLWKGTSGAFSIKNVVDAWGEEKQYYNYDDNSCMDGEVCGHYTQMVWEETTMVGCGSASCDGFDI